MPVLGEIKKNDKGSYFIWSACIDCGKERWVYKRGNKKVAQRCRHCATRGKRSSQWKGGIINHTDGYREILLYPNDFFYPMAVAHKSRDAGYILEHRLVMAKHLGRLLHPWEQVHHINGVRTDNRIENLKLVMVSSHDGKIKCPFCYKEFHIK